MDFGFPIYLDFRIIFGKEKSGMGKLFQIFRFYAKMTKVMNQQITIEVSEQVWRRANVLARQNQRKPENVLEEWLEETVAETQIEDLTNEEILALTENKFDDEQQNNFSLLLTRNREGTLNDEGKRELDEMMRIYETGLLRKSKALRVAVERGLIAPLAG